MDTGKREDWDSFLALKGEMTRGHPALAGFSAGRSGGTALLTWGSAAVAGAIAGLVTGGFNIVVLDVLWNVFLGLQGPLSPGFWARPLGPLDSLLHLIGWLVGAPVVLGAMGGVVGWVRPAEPES